jgi:NADH-quinone oxidoreductase subunit N
MNTLIIISVLPIVLLYLGLYKASKGIIARYCYWVTCCIGFRYLPMDCKRYCRTNLSGMMLFNNFSVVFSSVTIIIYYIDPVVIKRLF